MLSSEKTYSKVNYNISFFFQSSSEAETYIIYKMLIKKFILEMFSEKKCSFQAFRSLSADHFKLKQWSLSSVVLVFEENTKQGMRELKQWSQARDSARDGDTNPIRHLNNCSELVLV
jgi:hypothetical protein